MPSAAPAAPTWACLPSSLERRSCWLTSNPTFSSPNLVAHPQNNNVISMFNNYCFRSILLQCVAQDLCYHWRHLTVCIPIFTSIDDWIYIFRWFGKKKIFKNKTLNLFYSIFCIPVPRFTELQMFLFIFIPHKKLQLSGASWTMASSFVRLEDKLREKKAVEKYIMYIVYIFGSGQ